MAKMSWMALGFALAGVPLQASATVFFDGTFADADWTSQQLIATGAFPSDPNATFSAGQVASGGNSGAYRTVTQTYQGPNQGIYVAHVNSTEVYDPSISGAIAGLSFGFDVDFFNYPGTCCGPSFAVGYAPLVQQGGSFFLGQTAIAIQPNWIAFALPNQTAADFVLMNGDPLLATSHPDFSATGGSFTIGYATFNGTAGASQTSTTSGLDNWSVTVNDIPEPSGVPMLVFGAVALATIGARLPKSR